MPVKFILFDISPKLVSAWNESFPNLVSKDVLENITIKGASLEDLNMPFDTVVSPANSFGRLDGSFDQVLSDWIAPEDDNDALTHAAQAVLYARWRGYAPAGTCTLVPLGKTKCANNKLGVRHVALCPTMRIPESVRWHKEVVYNCVWSLLVEIDNHNEAIAEDSEGAARRGLREIETVAMTGLATGVGRVPVDMCARQMALAFAHYHEAKAKPEKWGALQWTDIINLPSDAPTTRGT
ncbi:macro domain-like protein [Dichomitus squalens]|uniref:Macro domain-like protein n=1 Tax=Dichomitus squalens TaxID=114155 RepID=A0A4Q9M5W9_9APHY|nr:macro domain-like protein [Dichomitus squalens]